MAAYSSQRPSSATSTSSTSLSKIIPSLLTAVEEETDHVQDAFQANICLGWLHFVLDEPGLAVARLPKNIAAAISSLSSGENKLSGWTQVCFIKGAYLKGMICKCFHLCKIVSSQLTVARFFPREDSFYGGSSRTRSCAGTALTHLRNLPLWPQSERFGKILPSSRR